MRLQKPTLPLITFKNVLALLFISILTFSCGDSGDDTVENPDENAECESFEAAVSQAQQALQNAPNSEYESLCAAYQEAINLQIQECGDEDGTLQAIIDDLGDCTLVVEPPVSDADFYITGYFNGEPIVMETGTSENYYLGCGTGYSINGDPGENVIRGYSSMLASILPYSEAPIGDMAFDYMYQGPYAPPLDGTYDPAFNSSFPVGSYEPTVPDSGEAGMRFEFYPEGANSAASIYYTTEYGEQPNTNFEITASVSDNYTQNGNTYYRQIITGTFNCTLYSYDADPIEVTDGTFRLRVEDVCY